MKFHFILSVDDGNFKTIAYERETGDSLPQLLSKLPLVINRVERKLVEQALDEIKAQKSIVDDDIPF